MNPGLIMLVYGFSAAVIGFIVGTMYPGLFVNTDEPEEEDKT